MRACRDVLRCDVVCVESNGVEWVVKERMQLGIEANMWKPGDLWRAEAPKKNKETWEHGSMGENMASWGEKERKKTSLKSTLFLGIYFRTTASESRTGTQHSQSHTCRIKSYQNE